MLLISGLPAKQLRSTVHAANDRIIKPEARAAYAMQQLAMLWQPALAQVCRPKAVCARQPSLTSQDSSLKPVFGCCHLIDQNKIHPATQLALMIQKLLMMAFRPKQLKIVSDFSVTEQPAAICEGTNDCLTISCCIVTDQTVAFHRHKVLVGHHNQRKGLPRKQLQAGQVPTCRLRADANSRQQMAQQTHQLDRHPLSCRC